MKIINVAKNFTRFPSGRLKKNGETSGEGFREKFLEGPLRDGQEVTIELDGTIGYSSSFLEESFGGIVRVLRVPPHELKLKLHLVSEDPTLIEEIQGYIDDAGKRLN